MRKAITAVVAVLLIGSSAMAQINLQSQNWNFGLNNAINLSGGAGTAATIQGIGTLSVQDIGVNPDQNGDPTATASQGVGVALFQAGGVETFGKVPAGLTQSLTVAGVGLVTGIPFPAGQVQSVGDAGDATLQYEGVSVGGTQNLTKASGAGAEVEGLNLAAFGMGQVAVNTCVDGVQASVIIGGQFSELAGAAQSVGTVTTGMNATVQQYQAANTPPAPDEP